MLEEVTEGMWPSADQRAWPGWSRTPHPFPCPWNIHSAYHCYSGSGNHGQGCSHLFLINYCGCVESYLWHMGFSCLWHVGSYFPDQGSNCVPCNGSLNHWTTKEFQGHCPETVMCYSGHLGSIYDWTLLKSVCKLKILAGGCRDLFVFWLTPNKPCWLNLDLLHWRQIL